MNPQITKQIAKVNGESVFTATLTITNEFGEIRVLAFVATKSHSAFESALVKMRDSLVLYGHSEPLVMYVDNPAADKAFCERIFPSLTKEVVPVEKYPTLRQFSCLDYDVLITTHSTIPEIDTACAHIVDDLDHTDLSAHLVVGFDAEWNVDMVTGGGPRPTSIVQIAYKQRVFIIQVNYHFGRVNSMSDMLYIDWPLQGQSSSLTAVIFVQSAYP